MDPWSKEIVWNFYTKAEEKLLRNSKPERREILGNKLNDSIYFEIAKPIHIDEVCPSARFHNSPEINPYLQCIQHFRRFEFFQRGLRWFDIKRFGISYSHVIGKDARVETLRVLDPRLAFQIPNEIIAAGIDPNDRLNTQSSMSAPKIKKDLAVPYNE
jgi:hypothetical protein